MRPSGQAAHRLFGWPRRDATRSYSQQCRRRLPSVAETRFALMHIGYPYEHEFIALAKHYPKAAIDMCWAWIINPVAGVRFLKEFLMAVPSSKIFTFGGDYVAVEPIYGPCVGSAPWNCANTLTIGR
nr:amidohydrolase family protein [Bradyrhizobium hipponense]